jgi:hypothetical protein
MVARNDVTGDAIQTKSTSQSYRDNFDNIFRKEKNMQVRVTEDGKKFGSCGCGRSPTGDCIGWHGLNEQQLKEAQEKYEKQQASKTE